MEDATKAKEMTSKARQDIMDELGKGFSVSERPDVDAALVQLPDP